MKRPAGIVLSAVFLALLSLFQIVMALGMALAASIGHEKGLAAGRTGAAAVPPPPAWMHGFMYGVCVFFLALAVWGIVTTIGVYRLRGWARISILVIAGCMAVLGFFSMLATLGIMFIPLPAPPGAAPAQAHSIQIMGRAVFAVIALLHGILLAIGVWWLVYFNRRNVRMAFAGAMGELPEGRRPLLISIYAVLSLIGALCCPIAAFIPIPAALFGAAIQGWVKIALYSVIAILELAIAIGLWQMREWGRRLALGMLVIGAVNILVYVVRPGLTLLYMAQTNSAMGIPQPALSEHFYRALFESSYTLSLLFVLAIAYMLHYYRVRFAQPDQPPVEQPPPPV